MDINKILEVLKKIPDPQTGKDIVTMRMIKDLRIDDPKVNFTLVLPSLSHPSKSQLNFACQSAIVNLYPTADVHIHVTADQSMASKSVLPQVKNIIAVASGKGGVGKSTVSVNLALALKETGAKVGLIDADLYGPSIPTMLGLTKGRPKVKDVFGQPKIIPLEAYGIQTMSMGFIIEPEQAVVLRGPRLSGVLKQFFNDCLWDELDYLVIDLPPGTGDVQLSLVQTVPVTGVVLVTTPQDVALADAVKAMNMFQLPNVNVPILGVVENMSWFTPEELPNNKYYLFGKGGGKALASKSNSMVLGQVPIVQGIREGGDSGKPVVAQDNHIIKPVFIDIAKKTIQQVKLRNEAFAPTEIVKMQS